MASAADNWLGWGSQEAFLEAHRKSLESKAPVMSDSFMNSKHGAWMKSNPNALVAIDPSAPLSDPTARFGSYQASKGGMEYGGKQYGFDDRRVNPVEVANKAAPAPPGSCGVCGGAHSTASHVAALQQAPDTYDNKELPVQQTGPDYNELSTGNKAGGSVAKTLGDIGTNVYDKTAKGLKGLTAGDKGKRKTNPFDRGRGVSAMDALGLSSIKNKGVVI